MSTPERHRTSRTLVVFAILVIPLLAGASVDTGWSWGWDHLHRIGTLGTLAVVLIGLALWARPASRASERIFERIGNRLSLANLRFPVLVALLGIALFAALPIATRIYGDSRYILDDYSTANLATHLEKMLSFGLLARGRASFVLHDLIARATGLSYERSYVVVSVLCGGIYLFGLLRLAARLPMRSNLARAAISWIILTDGANQLFFGHVEVYTLPHLFGSLFFVEVVRSLFDPRHGRIRALPILWFLLAVFFHSQTLVYLPTLLLWLGWAAAARKPALGPWVGTRALFAGLLLAVAGLVIAYLAFGSTCYDYIYSGGKPHPRQLFLPVTTSCIGLPYLRYTLFSSAHVLDFLGSLYSISSPAILLVIVVLLPAARVDARTGILAASIVTAVLHNFMINPAIGFPFDWDLMCVLSPPLLFTAIFLLARAEGLPRGITPALLILGLGTVALFGINANEKAVRGRIEDMGIWLHRTYYGGSHYRLSANLSTIRDPLEQARERSRVLERLAPQIYPDDREVAFLWEKLARQAIDLQDYEGALRAYRKAYATQPSRWERTKPVGYLEVEIGDLQRGIQMLRGFLEKAPADGEAWLFLGDAEARRENLTEAERCWRRFLELDPNAPEAPRVQEELQHLHPVPGPPSTSADPG